MDEKKVDPVMMGRRDNGLSAALKVAVAIVGVGVVAGATLVIGMDRIMRKIFVNESWPQREWANEDWAEEELE